MCIFAAQKWMGGGRSAMVNAVPAVRPCRSLSPRGRGCPEGVGEGGETEASHFPLSPTPLPPGEREEIMPSLRAQHDGVL
jgi:hypothetical protein